MFSGIKNYIFAKVRLMPYEYFGNKCLNVGSLFWYSEYIGHVLLRFLNDFNHDYFFLKSVLVGIQLPLALHRFSF